MAKSYVERYRVAPGSRVRLHEIDPDHTGGHEKKKDAQDEIARDEDALRRLQYLLYAQHEHALLIVLQGMDASGKDGTVRHVFGAVNPQGVSVRSFKVPTPEEADHDFLWRIHPHVPGKGEVAIFNRSHYEDVTVPRVHRTVPEHVWRERYEIIRGFEHGLVAAGTTVLKFFLHISPEEQLARFEARLDDPDRRWKISEADYAERAFFPRYVEAYEDAISATSTDEAPWFVIPANHKWYRNLAVARIVVEMLEGLKMSFPPPTVDLDEIRRKYHEAAHPSTSSR